MLSNSTPSGFSSGFNTSKGENTIDNGFSDENICGEGASGIVYSIRLNGLRVAIKRLRKEFRTNPT